MEQFRPASLLFKVFAAPSTRNFSIVTAILTIGLLLQPFSPPSSLAAPYAGIGFGWVIDGGEKMSDVDSYKVYLGYIPVKYFGVEGGFRWIQDIGSSTGTTTNQTSYVTDSKGFDLCGLGRIQFGIFDIAGKVGFFWGKTTTKQYWSPSDYYDSPPPDIVDTDPVFMWGFGVGPRFDRLVIRLDWESIFLETPETINQIQLSLTLDF